MQNFTFKDSVFFVLLLIFIPQLCFAQLIDNTDGEVFTINPFFNEQEIKEKGIKSISGRELHYKLGDKPRETAHFTAYHFNNKGQLVEKYESVPLTLESDTLVSYFDYDNNGNLIAIRQRDEFGNYAYLFSYDDKGRVIQKEYRRYLSNKPYRTSSFVVSKEYTVSLEKSTYQEGKGKYKRTLFNDQAEAYKTVTTYLNRKGLKTQEIERLNRMPGMKKTNYYYDHKSDLDSITVHSTIYGNQKESFVFEYDRKQNLTKKKVYKNGKYIKQFQVLYDENSALIDDVLEQDIATNFIKVLELRNYGYYH